VDNWKKVTNSRNRVRKKSFGGTFCFSNCHIIALDTGGLVFLVSVPSHNCNKLLY
jgi:lipocalin